MPLATARPAPSTPGEEKAKRRVPKGLIIAGGVGVGLTVLTLVAVRARAQARDEALARGEIPPDDGFLGTLTNLLVPSEDPLAGAGGGLPGGDGGGGEDDLGGGDRDGDGRDDGGDDQGGDTLDPDLGDDDFVYECPPGYVLDPLRPGTCVRDEFNQGGGSQPPTCRPGYAWDGVTCRLVDLGTDTTTTTSGPGTGDGDGDGFDWAPLFGLGLAGLGARSLINDWRNKRGDDGRGPQPEEPEAPRRGPEEPRAEEPRRPPPDEAPRGEPERARTSGVGEPRPPGETPGVRSGVEPRPAGESPFSSRGTGALDARTAEAARVSPAASETSLLGKARNVRGRTVRAAGLAGDILFLYEGGVVLAEGAPGIVQGAKAILTGAENVSPEEAQRIRDDTAKTAKEGSSLLSLGFAGIDLADRDKMGRSAFKLGVPDWFGITPSPTGNFFRGNVEFDPNARFLGFIPIKGELEENNLPAPKQFAEGTKTLLQSDNLAQQAVGVAVAPAAIVAEATTIPPSQFLSGAQNLANAAGQKAAEAADFAGQKASEAGAAVGGAAAYGYEKTGLGSVGGFFTDRGLNPFASPPPAAPPPVTPSFASQEKNDRDYAVWLAKQGKTLPSNLSKYEAEVAAYRPPAPAPASAPSAAPPPLTELQRRILSGTEPRPSTPAPLTEEQRRILSGTERRVTPAAPQPTLGPNNSGSTPAGTAQAGPTYDQRRLVGDVPATPPKTTAPSPRLSAQERKALRLEQKLAAYDY